MQPERGRTALFIPSLAAGGAERAFINLARGMAEMGESVDFVVGSANGPFSSEIPPNVTLVDLGAPRLLLAIPGFVRYLIREKPVRLYSALEEANIVAIIAAKLSRQKVRLYPSLRNSLSMERETIGGLKIHAMVRLAGWLYPSADGVFAVSESVADDAAALLKLPRDRITVLPNPTITPEIFDRAGDPCPHPWFAPDAPPVVLGCGRLSEQKDFATLIRAFARVRRTRPARLIILGDGPLRGELEALVEELGVGDDVALPGFDSNPFAYMARSAVFVLSSIFEGSPNVIIQALALGVPVISTDCPGESKALLNGVASSQLVPMRDPEAAAAAIAKVLDPSYVRTPRPDLARFGHRASAAAYLGQDALRAAGGAT